MTGLIFALQELSLCSLNRGSFYVIEKFHSPAFVLNEDGEPKKFNTYREAADEADLCQNGYVINL
jgi:hypothetical protein